MKDDKTEEVVTETTQVQTEAEKVEAEKAEAERKRRVEEQHKKRIEDYDKMLTIQSEKKLKEIYELELREKIRQELEIEIRSELIESGELVPKKQDDSVKTPATPVRQNPALDEADGYVHKIHFYRDDEDEPELTVLEILKYPTNWPIFLATMFGVSLFLGGIMHICGMAYISITALYMFFLISTIVSSVFGIVTKGLPRRLIEDEKINVVVGRIIFFVLHTGLTTWLMFILDNMLAGIRATTLSIVLMAVIYSSLTVPSIKPKGWIDPEKQYV